MPYVDPGDVVTGTPIATTWGDNVRNSLQFLANPPACRVHNSSTQSLTNNVTTALLFNTERFDTDAMHSTSTLTSRITFNTAGIYVVTGHVQLQGDTDYTSIIVTIMLGGGTPLASTRETAPGVSANQKQFSVATIYKFSVGQYVELTVNQENTSAGANTTIVSTNTSPEFAAAWVGLG